LKKKILQRALYKLNIDAISIQAGKFNNKSNDQERKEMLQSLIREGYTENPTGDDDFFNVSQHERDKQLDLMLARNLQELKLYKAIDRDRENREKTDWTEKGNKGPRPPRLMQQDELPKWMMKENVDFEVAGVGGYGRGHRERRDINYDDGLSDSAFTKMIEENSDPEPVVVKKKRGRPSMREIKEREEREREIEKKEKIGNYSITWSRKRR